MATAVFDAARCGQGRGRRGGSACGVEACIGRRGVRASVVPRPPLPATWLPSVLAFGRLGAGTRALVGTASRTQPHSRRARH
jgi:hypothetical protein